MSGVVRTPPTPPGTQSVDDRRPFREQTVLLGSFSAHDLVSPQGDEGTTDDVGLQDFLLEECTRITTSRGRRWCLMSGPGHGRWRSCARGTVCWPRPEPRPTPTGTRHAPGSNDSFSTAIRPRRPDSTSTSSTPR
ncbi:hypothetical protein H4K38_28355 [Streptomyces sp. I3(2020)]|nr:hypothetical protein [Streptomyces sp. I3(2020)]